MGETEFLNIKFDHSFHSRFCHILICDDISIYHGIRFRPISGNSIFWYNINENGYGDNSSFHAGLPPGENGQKIGLNTWTHEGIFISP
jgi:prolyl 4-hydroxylase